MELINKKQMVKFSRYSLAQKKVFRPQRDCFRNLHFLTSCGIYLHSKHLKIVHSMHLKLHLPWYMNRKNTLYWSQISGIMEHLTSCGVYIHSMHLKLHLPWLNEDKKYTVLEPDFWLSWNSPHSTHYHFTSRHIVLLFAQPIMSLHPSLLSRGQLWRGLVPKYILLCM
jgi:hypothetical protein